MRTSIIGMIVLLFCLISFRTHAQGYNPPRGYELVTAEDYAPYEPDVIAAANWLISTPLNEQKDKRLEISAFVFKWINGSPNVFVEVFAPIMDFEKKNPGLLIVYMAGCAKYVLENNYTKDKLAIKTAGINSIVKACSSGKGINKDKKIEELLKNAEEGKLDAWIEKNISFKE